MNILETLKSFFIKKTDIIKIDDDISRTDLLIDSLKNIEISSYLGQKVLKTLKNSLDSPNITLTPKQREEIIKLTKRFEVEPKVRKSFNDNKN